MFAFYPASSFLARSFPLSPCPPPRALNLTPRPRDALSSACCSMTDKDFEVAKAEFLTLKKANQARLAAGEAPEKSQQYLA